MNLRLAIIFCIVVFAARANGKGLTAKEKFQIFTRRAKSFLSSNIPKTKLNIRTDSWSSLEEAPRDFQKKFIAAYATELEKIGLHCKDESYDADKAAFDALDEQLKLFIKNLQDSLREKDTSLKGNIVWHSQNSDILKFFGVYYSMIEEKSSIHMIDEIAKMKRLYRDVSDDGAITIIVYMKFNGGYINQNYPAGTNGEVWSGLSTEEKFQKLTRRAKNFLSSNSRKTEFNIRIDSWSCLVDAPLDFQEKSIAAYATKLEKIGLNCKDESNDADKAAFDAFEEQLKLYIENLQDTLRGIDESLKENIVWVLRKSDILKFLVVYNSMIKEKWSKPMFDEIAKMKRRYPGVSNGVAITVIVYKKFNGGYIKQHYPPGSSWEFDSL